jgi:hypothetical protein
MARLQSRVHSNERIIISIQAQRIEYEVEIGPISLATRRP